MKNYQHSVTIAARPAEVYAALTTIEGLRDWWTQQCDGSSELFGTIHFHFGAIYKDMRVERLMPDREVVWLCNRAHIVAESLTRNDEWVGTRPVFRISDNGQGGTQLDFEHIGLVPSFECYDMCDKGWRYFLGSLQQYVETGKGTPYVHDNTPCHASMERSKAA